MMRQFVEGPPGYEEVQKLSPAAFAAEDSQGFEVIVFCNLCSLVVSSCSEQGMVHREFELPPATPLGPPRTMPATTV